MRSCEIGAIICMIYLLLWKHMHCVLWYIMAAHSSLNVLFIWCCVVWSSCDLPPVPGVWTAHRRHQLHAGCRKRPEPSYVSISSSHHTNIWDCFSVWPALYIGYLYGMWWTDRRACTPVAPNQYPNAATSVRLMSSLSRFWILSF